jgi:cyanophycinase-like exopeptidase
MSKLSIFIASVLVLSTIGLSGQTYTSYFTGNAADKVTSANGGVVLMGGATESDDAMRWFLNRANGGDILVLRASGSDGYNTYLYTELGVEVNSVESIVFKNRSASNENYILDKIKKAEGIWLAGGDQSKYVDFWRNTKVDSLINEAIVKRNVVIGGTSAGMAILGAYYYSALKGSVTSEEALSNPYHESADVDHTPFLKVPFLSKIITDTHFDTRDRFGRLSVFMGKTLQDEKTFINGIACEEYTAVCIDENGKAAVFGDDSSVDFAYFVTQNCEVTDNKPEICKPNTSFKWSQGEAALKVYKVAATKIGENYFSLTDGKNHKGGTWYNWFANGDGLLKQVASMPSVCLLLNSTNVFIKKHIILYPNPTRTKSFRTDIAAFKIDKLTCFDDQGKPIAVTFDSNLLVLDSNFTGVINFHYSDGLDVYTGKGYVE